MQKPKAAPKPAAPKPAPKPAAVKATPKHASAAKGAAEQQKNGKKRKQAVVESEDESEDESEEEEEEEDDRPAKKPKKVLDIVQLQRPWMCQHHEGYVKPGGPRSRAELHPWYAQWFFPSRMACP